MATSALTPALTGVQKSAILLVALGDQISSELLRYLPDEDVHTVTTAIANLPSFSQEQAEAVLEEFHAVTMDAATLGRGGVEFATRLLTNAFGPDGSKKHVDRLPQSGKGSALERLDPQLLVRFLRTEHPQTAALILSHLSASQSAVILAAMDADVRADLALRIARLDQISPSVISKISNVIGQKLKSAAEIKREPSGGPRAVAEIFNQLEGTLSDEILAQIGEQNEEVMEAIRLKMFVFDDLLSIDASGIKEVLGRADRKMLTTALKGASEEMRRHLLKGMSQRGSAMLLEDMEAMGPVKIRDVEAAQLAIIAVVRQLEGEGLVSRGKGGSSDEQYV